MNTKKMAKRLKDSGVSPVIATILMVAITVVLAAVLYVMVSGFTHSPGTANSAGLTESQNSAGNYTVSISSVSASNIHLTSLKLVAGGVSGSITTAPTTAGVFSGNLVSASGATTKIYFEVLTGNSLTYLQPGDIFYVVGTPGSMSGTTVTLYDGGSTLGSVTL